MFYPRIQHDVESFHESHGREMEFKENETLTGSSKGVNDMAQQ